MKLTVLLSCWAAIAAGKESNTRMANKGETANQREFPYLVSIQNSQGIHFCGGALITRTHVLTAAHCINERVDKRYFTESIKVEVGMRRLGTGKTYIVKRMSYRRGYTVNPPYYLPNDIGVVQLAEPIQLSAYVSTINLPQHGASAPVGTEVLLAGFGNEKFKGPISQVLKKMDSKIISLDECQGYYKSRGLQKDKICAKKHGYGAGQGDSGSPLVDKAKTTVIGVVSGGHNVYTIGYPDVYTDVSYFIPYINEELKYNQNNPSSNSDNPAINAGANTGNNLSPPGKIPGAWPGQRPSEQYPGSWHEQHPFQQRPNNWFEQQLSQQFSSSWHQQRPPQYPNFWSSGYFR